jgi:hypothetical protein
MLLRAALQWRPDISMLRLLPRPVPRPTFLPTRIRKRISLKYPRNELFFVDTTVLFLHYMLLFCLVYFATLRLLSAPSK